MVLFDKGCLTYTIQLYSTGWNHAQSKDQENLLARYFIFSRVQSKVTVNDVIVTEQRSVDVINHARYSGTSQGGIVPDKISQPKINRQKGLHVR